MSAKELNATTLGQFPVSIAKPAYDRSQVGQAIAHIGVGGFHRAHQLVYAEDLFHQGGSLEWGYCGLGLLSHDARMRDVLRRQDCLYTLVERSPAGEQARIVGSMVNFLHAPENREAVLDKLCAEETRIISLTITEGGYYIHSGTGEFDAEHPDIRHDLAHPHEPVCSFGYLIEAMDRRRKAGQPPPTLMSCDNIQGNGEVARHMLLAFAELRDPTLANWLSQQAAFPNSMVDRITPATTDEHRALVREQFGIDDGWPVMTEPFKQWVIEDHFTQGRPEWERAGAQMTSDVLPYEKMKLRLLNAAHQALCYIGMLFGYQHVHEAMEDADIRKLVERMMDEATPVIPPVPGVDLEDYKRTLIERFSNPAIRDQLSRIGIYGSDGMPKFVLPSIQELLHEGRSISFLSFTIACWFRYLNGEDEQGHEMDMKDPQAEKLKTLARQGGDDPSSLLAQRAIFSEELAGNAIFAELVRTKLKSFYHNGARATLMETLTRH